MGLLNSILRSVAKQAVSKAISESIDNAINNNGTQNTQNTAHQTAPTQTAQSMQPVTLTRHNIPANEAHFTSYDNGKEFDISFMLGQGYIEFNSHAMEIEYSAIYLPEFKEGDIVGYDSAKPVICMGDIDAPVEEVLNNFDKNGTVSAGSTIEKITDSNFKYRVTVSKNGSRYVSYCFNDSLYETMAFSAIYPVSLIGTQLEQLVLQQIELAAATFRKTEM